MSSVVAVVAAADLCVVDSVAGQFVRRMFHTQAVAAASRGSTFIAAFQASAGIRSRPVVLPLGQSEKAAATLSAVS